MMPRSLNVCLIGTGYMGKCHALAWNAVGPTFGGARPHLDLLVDVNDDLAARRTAEFGFSRSSSDWKAAVADSAIDVVSIATPTWMHAEMAIYALEQGKHVWCEKPMSLAIAQAEDMLAAAERAGRVAALGFNYIQNPSVRLMKKLIAEGAIGAVTHVRIEMDEDFMADPESPYDDFNSGPQSGGALPEFGVHPLSILQTLVGDVKEVIAEQWKPYASRKTPDGAAKEIASFDIAAGLMSLVNGASGTFVVNRSAWGRKGRLVVQIYGSAGALYYDQERLNEVQFYSARDGRDQQGFRTILSGPDHPPYQHFVPTPGHGLGFNDLKVIECRELLRAIGGEAAHMIDFAKGIKIERTIDAFRRSIETRNWTAV